MEKFILESIGFLIGFAVAGFPLILIFGGFFMVGFNLLSEVVKGIFGK